MNTIDKKWKTAARGSLLVVTALAAICGAYAQDPLPPGGAAPQVTQSDVDHAKRIKTAIDLYKAGKVDEAQAAFEAIHSDRAGDADAASWLGYIYLQKNRAAEAMPLLRAAHEARPADLDIETNLGNAYLATGDDENAGRIFEDLAQKQGDKASSHYNLGTIYLRQKHYDRAAEEMRRSLTLNGDDPYAYNNLGVAMDAQKDSSAAADAFSKASDLRPNNATFAKNAGMTAAKAGRWADADRYLSRAMSLDSHDGKVLVILAEAKLRTNQRSEARDLYERAKDADQDAAFWYNLGVMRFQVGDRQGAEEAYRKSLSMNDSDLDTLANLGAVLYRKGDYSGARDCFDKLAGLSPNSMAAKRNLAAACAMTGDTDRAASLWKQILADSPSDTNIRLNLASVQWRRGSFKEAHDNFAMILHSDAHNPEALNGMGLWQLKQGDLRGAAISFRGAIAAKPTFVSAYNNLAVTLEKLNRKPEAIALLKRASSMDGSLPEVQQNLRRMTSSR